MIKSRNLIRKKLTFQKQFYLRLLHFSLSLVSFETPCAPNYCFFQKAAIGFKLDCEILCLVPVHNGNLILDLGEPSLSFVLAPDLDEEDINASGIYKL